ncbi:MAG: hypothetical protein WBV69_24650 [Candidatus Sulfotelmatobacter sp.]
MGGHPFQQMPCTICSKPVDLTVDLFADEKGEAVHEDCYVNNLIGARNRAAVEQLLDTFSGKPRSTHCPKCGLLLSHVETTFSSQPGKVWTILLPVCKHCNGQESFAAA